VAGHRPPAIPGALRQELVNELMAAHRLVRSAPEGTDSMINLLCRAPEHPAGAGGRLPVELPELRDLGTVTDPKARPAPS
jgi:hypothetical protein